MAWAPAETQHLVILGDVPKGHLFMADEMLGTLVDSGIVAPPVGDPHVANQIYRDENGVLFVSAGPALKETAAKPIAKEEVADKPAAKKA